MWRRGSMIILCGLVVLGCGQRDSSPPGEGLYVVSDIAERRAQFVEQSRMCPTSRRVTAKR